eukprot:6329749-Amphidinium_carterae.1
MDIAWSMPNLVGQLMSTAVVVKVVGNGEMPPMLPQKAATRPGPMLVTNCVDATNTPQKIERRSRH